MLPAIIILAFVAIAGCHNKKKNRLSWAEKKSTQLVFGPYKLPIPAGWRDLSELHDKNVQLPRGTVGMTPEDPDAGAMRTNMIFSWTALPTGTPIIPCEQLAQLTGKQLQVTVSGVETVTIDGDTGCRWNFGNSDSTGVQIARFQDDHELVGQWVRMKSLGDSDASSDKQVWRDALTTLGFVPN